MSLEHAAQKNASFHNKPFSSGGCQQGMTCKYEVAGRLDFLFENSFGTSQAACCSEHETKWLSHVTKKLEERLIVNKHFIQMHLPHDIHTISAAITVCANPAAHGHSSYHLLTPHSVKVFAAKSSPYSRFQSALFHHMCQYADY